jgi:hypothetical protein
MGDVRKSWSPKITMVVGRLLFVFDLYDYPKANGDQSKRSELEPMGEVGEAGSLLRVSSSVLKIRCEL